MSVPPQGGWQPGPIPPNQGPPYGQPLDPSAYNPQQQPPPPGWQQGSWAQHPGPPHKGGGLKWLLIAVAVLLVVAVSIGATLLFTRDGGNGGDPTPTSAAPSDIASANDTGPVSIITEEPTCDAALKINSSVADVESNGWGDQRNSLGLASVWTPQQRDQTQAVATAVRAAADQMVTLAQQTPHRVVRELYEQYIAYGRAYADRVPNYVPADNFLADVNVSLGNVLLGICNAIEYGSASRSVAVSPVAAPTQNVVAGNPDDPQPFMTSSIPACAGWIQREETFIASTSDWERVDPQTPGSKWTPEQRSSQLKALTALTGWAEASEDAGRQSGNPTFEDFAILAALYMRGYVATGDNYISADSWLSYAALRLSNAVSGACKAGAG